MQPKSIQRFDMAYLGSLAVSTAGFFIGYDDTLAELNTALAPAGIDVGGTLLAGVFVVSMAISLLLWWLVSSKRSVVAKWILVIFFLFSVLGLVTGIQTMLANLSLAVGLQLLAFALSAASIYFLFTADAKPWFEKDEQR